MVSINGTDMTWYGSFHLVCIDARVWKGKKMRNLRFKADIFYCSILALKGAQNSINNIKKHQKYQKKYFTIAAWQLSFEKFEK